MEILVTIPETLTEHLQPEEPTAKHQLQRLLLEDAVAALYSAGKMTRMQTMAVSPVWTRMSPMFLLMREYARRL